MNWVLGFLTSSHNSLKNIEAYKCIFFKEYTNLLEEKQCFFNTNSGSLCDS